MGYNDIESLKVNVNGWQGHYLKAGKGRPVVLIHGGASDARDWTEAMSLLAENYSLYALDLLGYGQSERQESGYYLTNYPEFLLGFIDALKLDKPVIVGHSLGGRFCLDVALKDPSKISKLVLIDTTGLGSLSTLGTFLQYFFWAYRKVFRIKQPFPTFLLKPGQKFDHDYRKELRHLEVPTLIIWKSMDLYLPSRIGRRAVKLMPQGKLAIIKGIGHAPHKGNTEVFSKILADFLDDG